jgi:hypothetical protein
MAKAAILATLCTKYATTELEEVAAQLLMEFVAESIFTPIIVARAVITLEDEHMEVTPPPPPSSDTHGPNSSAQG